MKNTKAFIFDMDGLILDTERIAFRSYKEALKEYGYDFTEAFSLGAKISNAQEETGKRLSHFSFTNKSSSIPSLSGLKYLGKVWTLSFGAFATHLKDEVEEEISSPLA